MAGLPLGALGAPRAWDDGAWLFCDGFRDFAMRLALDCGLMLAGAGGDCGRDESAVLYVPTRMSDGCAADLRPLSGGCMASCAHVSNDDCACHAHRILLTTASCRPHCALPWLRLPWSSGDAADDSRIRIHRLSCRHLT